MLAILENQPSVTELAARSWRSLRQAFAAMPIFYVGVFLTYGLAAAGIDAITAYPALAAALPETSWLTHAAFLRFAPVILSVASLAIVAIAAVATHRFILLGDTRPKIGRNTLQFFLWLILVGAILLLLDVVKILDRRVMPDNGLTDLIGGVIWVAKLVVFIHFAFLFPAVAVGENDTSWRARVETSWRRMSGNFWLFLLSDIVALLPLILLLILITLALAFPMLGATREHGFFEAMLPWTVAVQMLRHLAEFPVLMVQAAIASWLYAWVRQQPNLASDPAADT